MWNEGFDFAGSGTEALELDWFLMSTFSEYFRLLDAAGCSRTGGGRFEGTGKRIFQCISTFLRYSYGRSRIFTACFVQQGDCDVFFS